MVGVGDRCGLLRLVDEHDRLDEEGDEQPVDDEARRVDALDRRLAEVGGEAHRLLEDLGRRLLGAHHLDELHQLHRVEEVQTHHLRWENRMS